MRQMFGALSLHGRHQILVLIVIITSAPAESRGLSGLKYILPPLDQTVRYKYNPSNSNVGATSPIPLSFASNW